MRLEDKTSLVLVFRLQQTKLVRIELTLDWLFSNNLIILYIVSLKCQSKLSLGYLQYSCMCLFKTWCVHYLLCRCCACKCCKERQHKPFNNTATRGTGWASPLLAGICNGTRWTTSTKKKKVPELKSLQSHIRVRLWPTHRHTWIYKELMR